MQVLQAQMQVGTDPKEVGRARRWARSRLAGSGIDIDGQLAETLVLLISELVTNAVVHTGCPAVLRMLLPVPQVPSVVRIEVVDASTCPPRQRRAEGEDTSGRGLELVSGLADRWGWQQEEGGKRIWCELDGEAADAEGALPEQSARERERGCVRDYGRERDREQERERERQPVRERDREAVRERERERERPALSRSALPVRPARATG